MRENTNTRSLCHDYKSSRKVSHWISGRGKENDRIVIGDCETQDKDREYIVQNDAIGHASGGFRESDSLSFGFVSGDADNFVAGVCEDSNCTTVPETSKIP